MFVSFRAGLRKMSGVRFGFRLHGWSAVIMAVVYGTFYLMWYMMLGVGWLMYGMLWLAWMMFKYLFVGIVWLYKMLFKGCAWLVKNPGAALVAKIKEKNTEA